MKPTESESARAARLAQRVSRDPASALFLPLAETYRRQGRLGAAESVLRAGLSHHHDHFSARTALGRLLLEVGRVEEAVSELERVHRAVPENLLATRLLQEAGALSGAVGGDVRDRNEPITPVSEAVAPAGPPLHPSHPFSPLDVPLPEISCPPLDSSAQRRVAALRRFLAGAVTLRGRHA